jgi:Flp pilus assembly protein TadG
MRRSFHSGIARPRQRAESGQAMVEFALILFPLLILVAGIIQFGIGLNYWLDMQRIANQGARWATVNNWPPDCPRGSASCTATPACNVSRTRTTLQNTLECQILSTGLRNAATVKVCYPNSTELAGDPVRVEISTPFTFVPILELGTITLRADATMRLEQRPTLLTGEVSYNTTTKRCT